MLRLLALLLTLLSLAQAQPTIVGRASVIDGDTLEVQGVCIRLWGIDAVESSQTCLDAAGPLGDGRYAIVAGERRYRAAKMAGLAEVPVRILDLPEKEARLLAQVATRLARLDLESLPPEKRQEVERHLKALLELLEGKGDERTPLAQLGNEA